MTNPPLSNLIERHDLRVFIAIVARLLLLNIDEDHANKRNFMITPKDLFIGRWRTRIRFCARLFDQRAGLESCLGEKLC